MQRLRFLGLGMFLYGAIMLALLFSPWKEWAANHSIAAVVSATDRRVGNSIDTPVDMPLSVAGDVVMMFAGLWIGLLVPRMLKKFQSGYQPQQPYQQVQYPQTPQRPFQYQQPQFQQPQFQQRAQYPQQQPQYPPPPVR